MLIRFTHDLRAALARNLIPKGHAQITQRNAPAPTIEHGAERAEQKGQPITIFARQKRNKFRGEFEPQPLQTVANLSRRAHRSSVSTLPAGCERPLNWQSKSRKNRANSSLVTKPARRGGSRVTRLPSRSLGEGWSLLVNFLLLT